MSNDMVSTTALSKTLMVETHEVFSALKNAGFIVKPSDKWELTAKGTEKGGIKKTHEKYGEYIAWPQNIVAELKELLTKQNQDLMTATKLAEVLRIAPQKINLIFSELGWIEKDDLRGWLITNLGKRLGGKQREHPESSKLYVVWPKSVLGNKSLQESLSVCDNAAKDASQADKGFRNKFPAEYRTLDGHFVRSRAEVIIDDYLYHNQIIHAYERKVPIEEDLYCDFYIPTGKKVYIEYWGKEGDAKYDERKKVKIELYKKYEQNLIELSDADINSLDDVFPGKLLKYDIKGYM